MPKTKASAKPPFAMGQYVEFQSPADRVEPFRADEVMEVQSLTKLRHGWRVRVFSVNRDASGWLDAGSLAIYGHEIGSTP
jgi:hypothetical protein